MTFPHARQVAEPILAGSSRPARSFVGQETEVERTLQRGVKPLRSGHPAGFFIGAGYGLGKTSLAQLVMGKVRKGGWVESTRLAEFFTLYHR